MFNLFSIMLAFLIVFAPYRYDAGQPQTAQAVWLATAASIAVPSLFGLVCAGMAGRAVARPSRLTASFFKKLRRLLALHHVLILIAFFALCVFFAWPEYVNQSVTHLPALDTLVKILPFLVSLIIAWTVQHAVETRLRLRTWPLQEKLIFQLRHTLVPLIPILFLSGVESLVRPATGSGAEPTSGWQDLVLFGAMLSIFAAFPLLIRALWPVCPMPTGALRSALEVMVAEHGVPLRNVLQWNTGGGHVLNACMIGVLPPLRYILVTDALIRALEPDEVRAVFGHELCHAKRNHVMFYGMFLFSLMLLFTLPIFSDDTVIGSVQVLTGLALWLLLFGVISRRFERECDLFGARAAGSFSAFIRALQKIAPPSASLSRLHSFLHFSIPRRVEFLVHVHADAAEEERFARKISWIRSGIFALFAASVTLAVLLGES